MNILYHRYFLLTVAFLNFSGAIWGFYWYRWQLLSTLWWQWLVVVDSPLHALLFGAFIYMMARQRMITLWTGTLSWLGVVGVIKYGIWAVGVLLSYFMVESAVPAAEDVLLILGHIGMAAEGIIYAGLLPQKLIMAVVSGLWFAFNDYCDYVYGLHPFLPSNSLFLFAGLLNAGLTVLLVVSVSLIILKKYKKKCKNP